jgi:superfamily II DNA or RNA helicase
VQVIKPLEHQEEILEKLMGERQKGRTVVIIPSGAGKTHLAAFHTLQAKDKNILYVAHRNEILEQASKIFMQVHGVDYSKIGFINQSKKDFDKDILFATNNSLARKKTIEELDAMGKRFDCMIVDEFHHVNAQTYQTLLETIDHKFMLGLTATPYRLDGKDVLAQADNNIVYEMSLKEGVDRKILVPFMYYGLHDNIDYSDIEWQGYKYKESDLDKKLLIDKRDNQIIKEYQEYIGTKRPTVGFCVSVKHCERITAKFRSKGINAHYIDYTIPIHERIKIINDFNDGKFPMLFTISVLEEGVDFPHCQGVLFLRPTFSKRVFFQQLGRGLRKNEGKQNVVVLDFIGNYHNAFYKKSWLIEAGGSPMMKEPRPQKPLYEHNISTVYFDKKVIDIFQYQARMMERRELMNPTKQQIVEDFLQGYKKLGYLPNVKDIRPPLFKYIYGRCYNVHWIHFVDFLR